MGLFPGPLAYRPAGSNIVFFPALAAMRAVLWSTHSNHGKNTSNDSRGLAVTQCALRAVEGMKEVFSKGVERGRGEHEAEAFGTGSEGGLAA